jgi:TamB, inner membrane protein subunit of TAM complex
LVLGIALTFPYVQTKIAQYTAKEINKSFGTHITIDQVAITVFGGVKLKKVLILDHHKDTLIYANRIKTNISAWNNLLDGDLIFGDVALDGVLFNLKTYKNEKDNNINVFIDTFGKSKPSKKHSLLTTKSTTITNARFVIINENHNNPKDLDLSKINLNLDYFKLYGSEINTTINKLSCLYNNGLFIKKLSTKFSYTKKKMGIENLDLTTEESMVKADVFMNYKIEDFQDFINRVQFDSEIYLSKIASNDIRHFTKVLGKDIVFNAKAKIKGTLNDLTLRKLNLSDSRNTQLIGRVNLKNLFPNNEQKFFMNGKFEKLTSSYGDLVNIVPDVLGKKLPVILKKLGTFTMVGDTQVSTKTLNADFTLATALGNIKSNLKMKDIDFIDRASYSGNVVLKDFDLGEFLDRKDLRKVTLDLDIDGKGFSKKYLNTNIKGDVNKIFYNNYTYNNVVLNGNFKSPFYKGQVSVNDPNLNMNFDGVLDLNKKVNKYDFHINVENADLRKLNFVNDNISKFRGDVVVKATGNSIENLEGDIFIKQTTYTNTKSTYNFDDFTIHSNFDGAGVRTILVNSPDIVEGEIVGRFQFNQLKNLVTNSLGSLYTNYKPLKVKKGQFLNFDFTIYNKIIEIFYPDISIGTNTIVKGNINSDNQEFKFNFNSPKIVASNITFDNIRFNIDNKNPLYNAYVEIDSIKTKQYKIRDLSLINVTVNDTLHFRTEFKGGEKGEDNFNLNLYHTINKENNNVVGISKSEIKFKDYLWFLNENNESNNQIVFDKKFKDFKIDDIILSHEKQSITVNGDIKGTTYKDLQLTFKDVDLNKITPETGKFVLNGNINGLVNYKQNKAIYEPTASIVVDHLNINKTDLGLLNFDISGDENLKKFTMDSNLINDSVESFNASGSFETINKETILDLELHFDKFNLTTLSSLGGNVISNIRGFVTGNASIQGNVKKPEIAGRLFADQAGLTIPYLNVDYALGDNSIIDVTEEKFLFSRTILTDTKHNTTGTLNGNISHNNFADWRLDLDLNSKKLLALDTKDSEDVAYFGTAFIDGSASIKGPTNGLFIKVDAKSEKGTSLKIPINNAENISENSFIHFVTPKEKFNEKNGIVDDAKKYNGLELEFDLDITPEAEVEVILDRNTGHGMKGKGFGSLLMKINTLGKFNMWGDFQAYEGTYNFKYGGVINKPFNIKKGGSIVWEGNPLKAQLNLEAVYKTDANPAVLLENSSFKNKIPVEVVIGIRGDLMSPEPDFNIEFPKVTNVMKSEIESKLSDKDIRQTQALYLLSTGGFFNSTDGIRRSDANGLVLDKVNDLLGSIIKTNNEKFKVDLNIIGAETKVGKESDGRFVASISTKLNERITVNGKVGVPFGGISQTAIVGDVEVLYRVNEDGTLNLRLFNKENDINYIGQGIGYTQGLGVTYEVDFDTFQELMDKIFKSKKKEGEKKTDNIDEDSDIMTPDGYHFTKEKKPKKEENPERNKEGTIPEND